MVNFNLSFSCTFNFEPIFTSEKEVYAFDVYPEFTNTEGKKFFNDDVMYFMSISVKKKYLTDILNEIVKKSSFLREKKALCSFHIDRDMALITLTDPEIKNIIFAHEFIRLSISINLLHDNTNNPGSLAKGLSEKYPIWLNDFSANPASFSAIRNIKFELVNVSDGTFKEYGDSVMFFSLIENISRYSNNICIQGVDTFAQLRMLKHPHITHIKGSLFSDEKYNSLD
ncbi:EAL domain-containing protein [Rahnella inusitata]|uniref:EAL domain-containing protein n=1 Tax=Rahnella inusitata TaxID=58169 RepID=UPI001BC8343F|nr:EAL domain-containing protein [Rahnella inusitata]QUT18076.1 EAL domain-containing protein [Rahnella inusitata]